MATVFTGFLAGEEVKSKGALNVGLRGSLKLSDLHLVDSVMSEKKSTRILPYSGSRNMSVGYRTCQSLKILIVSSL